MALLEVLAHGDVPYQSGRDTVQDVAPVYVVLFHEGIEDVLLAAEHAVEHRFGVMGKTRYGEERHQNEYLEDLKVGQLAVVSLDTPETAVVDILPLQKLRELFHYG